MFKSFQFHFLVIKEVVHNVIRCEGIYFMRFGHYHYIFNSTLNVKMQKIPACSPSLMAILRLTQKPTSSHVRSGSTWIGYTQKNTSCYNGRRYLMELILLVWIVMRFRWNDIYFNSSRSVFFPINLLTNKMNQLSVITTKLKKRFANT